MQPSLSDLPPTAWLLALGLSVGSWGYQAFIADRSFKPELRKVGLHWANLALSGAVVYSIALLLIKVFVPGGLAPASRFFSGSFIVLSLVCLAHLPWRRSVRGAVAAALLSLPLLALGYVGKREEVRVEFLDYQRMVQRPSLVDTHNEERRPSLVELAAFAFTDKPTLICGEGDSACLDLKRRLDGRDTLAAVALQALFWFLSLWSVLRYYGHVYRLAEWGRRQVRSEEYNLKAGVMAQSAAVLSFVMALVAALLLAGVNLGQLGLFGGLAAAGATVALKDSLGNFAAGIVLLWDGTIRKGDVVTIERPENPEAGGTYGVVDDVRLRYTVIKDRDTVHRLIPNSILINSVVENWTHDADKKVRLKVPVPVPYGVDLKQVRTILESSCYEVIRVLKLPAPKALVAEFADSAIVFSLRFWISDPEAGIRSVISDVYTFASERLGDVGIKVPFPQMDVHIKDYPGATKDG